MLNYNTIYTTLHYTRFMPTTMAMLVRYLDFPPRGLVLHVVESVGAIANVVLLHELLRVRAALRGHSRDVLNTAQV